MNKLMKKYISKIFIITVVFAAIGSSVVVAKLIPDEEIFTDFFDNGYYHKLLSRGPNDKAGQVEINKLRVQVLKRQAAIEARKKMTPQEIAAGEKQLNNFTNELARQQALHPSPNVEAPLGIFEINSVTEIDKEFYIINQWRGKSNYMDEEKTMLYGGVYAGNDISNPHQGQILIYNQRHMPGNFYSTPTATGPVRIVSEKDGVLTLKSIGGEYKVYNPSLDAEHQEKVKVKGGMMYYFNLKTRLFK